MHSSTGFLSACRQGYGEKIKREKRKKKKRVEGKECFKGKSERGQRDGYFNERKLGKERM